MTARSALQLAQQAGVRVTLDGDRVSLSAASPPSTDLLDQMRHHKAEIMAILVCEACRHCGAAPQSLEIGGFSPAGWTCDNCLAAGGFLAIARSVLVEDDAGGPIVRMAGSSRGTGLRRWHDDRGWIADVTSAATADEKLAVLATWVAAAGGRLLGGTADLPALPRRLATLELRRMLRQAGVAVREASVSAGVSP